MKKINYIFALVAAVAIALSCDKMSEERPSGELVKVSFRAGRPDASSAASPSSKTDISPAGVVSWNLSDHLAVFTDVDGSNSYNFSINTEDAGKASAQFWGSVPSNGTRAFAYAVYPWADNYSGGPAALEVSVPAEQVSGENYTLMAGKAAVAGDDFSAATVSMKHLCWLYDINITNSSAKAIKAVHFSAGSAVFATTGTVDLTADNPSVSGGSKVKDVSVEFASAQSTDVTARFALLPLSCTDVDFNIHVVFEDGFYETFAIGSKSLNISAGKRKSNTFVLGEGTASKAPWGWYFVAKGTTLGNTLVSNAIAGTVNGDAKLWLESNPTSSEAYTAGARLDISQSLWIASDPNNVQPTITSNYATLIRPKTDSNIETISLKNVIVTPKADNASSYVFDVPSTITGAVIGDIVIENCSLQNFKSNIVYINSPTTINSITFKDVEIASTVSNSYLIYVKSVTGAVDLGDVLFKNCAITGITNCISRFESSTGAKMSSITLDGCIIKPSSSLGTLAMLHALKSDAVILKNNTFEVIACFMYYTMGGSEQTKSFALTVENNTFANTKANNSNKYMFYAQNNVKIVNTFRNNLFVGSNGYDSSAEFTILRVGSVASNYSATVENNWFTSDWKTYTTKTGTGYYDMLTNQSTLLNAALCPGYASSDFTVAAGSDVRAAGAGDPRWLN